MSSECHSERPVTSQMPVNRKKIIATKKYLKNNKAGQIKISFKETKSTNHSHHHPQS